MECRAGPIWTLFSAERPATVLASCSGGQPGPTRDGRRLPERTRGPSACSCEHASATKTYNHPRTLFFQIQKPRLKPKSIANEVCAHPGTYMGVHTHSRGPADTHRRRCTQQSPCACAKDTLLFPGLPTKNLGINRNLISFFLCSSC